MAEEKAFDVPIPATAEDIAYTYDQTAGGNKGKGRLTRIADQTGNTAFVYDVRGNVTKETRIVFSKTHVISYAYDLADRLTQITYPSGRIVIYARDVNGRITGVTTKQNATAPVVTVASSIVYLPVSSLVQSFAAGNGLTTLNTYTLDIVPEARLRHEELDLLGVYMSLARLRQDGPAERRMRSGHPKAQPWVIERTHSRTDKLNLTNVWDNVATANNQSFAYSNANRLNATTGPWGTSSTTYDGVGNRTSEVSTPVGGSAVTRTYTYPSSSNRLSNVKIGTTTERSFLYDGAGNMTRDTRSGTAYVYAYNKRNRLASLTVGGVTTGTYRTILLARLLQDGLEQLVYRSLTNMPVPAQAGNAERHSFLARLRQDALHPRSAGQPRIASGHYVAGSGAGVIASCRRRASNETDGTGPAGTFSLLASGKTREYIWLPALRSPERLSARA